MARWQHSERDSRMNLMTKLILIGTPVFYLLGTVGFGSMYLSYGAPSTLDAFLFGAQ